MDAILIKHIGEYRYEVFYDVDYSINDIDFDAEYAKEIEKRLDSGSLNSYGIVKSNVCKCCCMWSEIDSMWGILHETASDALDEFIDCYGNDK